MIVVNCDTTLSDIGAQTIKIPYDPSGSGVTKNINDFFTNNNAASCDLTCNFGDVCGPSAPLNQPNLSVTNSNYPFEITARNDQVSGYTNELTCLYCTSAYTGNVF